MYRVIWNYKIYPFDTYSDASIFKANHPGAVMYERCYH